MQGLEKRKERRRRGNLERIASRTVDADVSPERIGMGRKHQLDGNWGWNVQQRMALRKGSLEKTNPTTIKRESERKKTCQAGGTARAKA